MDKIIDDLLRAPKITILFKEKQLLVRLQSDVFLPARGNMTNTAAVYHVVPHCGVQVRIRSHCRRADLYFQNLWCVRNYMYFGFCEDTLKEEKSKEAAGSDKNPPGTQSLPYASFLSKPLNKLHISEISPF